MSQQALPGFGASVERVWDVVGHVSRTRTSARRCRSPAGAVVRSGCGDGGKLSTCAAPQTSFAASCAATRAARTALQEANTSEPFAQPLPQILKNETRAAEYEAWQMFLQALSVYGMGCVSNSYDTN